MPEHPRALAPERFPHRGRREHRAERQVTARDPLGAGHDVRLEAEPLAREPRAASSEPGDHFVGDEQDPEVATDATGLLEVPGWGRQYPAGAHHGLAEEPGYPPLPELVDRVVERVRVVPR